MMQFTSMLVCRSSEKLNHSPEQVDFLVKMNGLKEGNLVKAALVFCVITIRGSSA